MYTVITKLYHHFTTYIEFDIKSDWAALMDVIVGSPTFHFSEVWKGDKIMVIKK